MSSSFPARRIVQCSSHGLPATQRLSIAAGLALAVAAALAAAAPMGMEGASPVRISALFCDGYAEDDRDEAVQLWNTGPAPVDIGGWRLVAGSGETVLPDGLPIAAGHWLWLARDSDAFARSFGHAPDWAWATDAAPRPTLPNHGSTVALYAADGALVDSVPYGDAAEAPGWTGPSVQAYSSRSVSAAHQVIYRKLDALQAMPIADTDAASDWASDRADPIGGRRFRFPGWDLEEGTRHSEVTAPSRLEIAVAPDALHAFLAAHLAQARRSIDLFAYTMDNPDLAERLAALAASGVRVRLMLDGSPAGGVSMSERWCVATVAAAGAEVFWHDDGGNVGRRYRSAHAKISVIDDRIGLVGSENIGLAAAPYDSQQDGTAGHRGTYVATDAPGVVEWLRDIVRRDLDPDSHPDMRPYQVRDLRRGAPAPDFAPEREGGGALYQPRWTTPLALEGRFTYRLVSAPENALAPGWGVLGLASLAGPGGEVLVEQLREPLWWGEPSVDGAAAANPRLDAYVEAARRGARVRVLLDGYWDDPQASGSNAATVAHLTALAHREALDLQARLGNPSGLGLHNKMVLVRASDGTTLPGVRGPGAGPAGVGAAWVHIGSVNGTEVSSKANREVAIEVGSAAAYEYLAEVFASDWAASAASDAWLPWVGCDGGPTLARPSG